MMMTPKERKRALQLGQDVDRLPITLFHPDFAAKILGMTIHEANFSSEKLAQREINMYRQFGVDEISVMYFNLPKYTHSLIHDYQDIDRLNPEDYRFDKDRRQQINAQAIDQILDQVGQEVDLTYGISGPITLAGGLMGHELMLRGLRRKPEAIHRLLRFTTDFLVEFAKNCQKWDLDYFIFDPVASTSLLSPKQFKEFALPYLQETIAAFHQQSDQVHLHICGNTTKILEDIALTGCDYFSLDQVVDLAEAKLAVGDQIGLMGNVNPTDVFMKGTPADVWQAVEECYHKGYGSPKGYIIRSGCGLPYNTPVENVQDYMEAASHYSREILAKEG